MANPEHVAKLRQGPAAWNRWRRKNGTLLPNLREAKLRRLHLSGADLHEAGLGHADLVQTDLSTANLERATLSETDLRRANLNGAILAAADVRGADLRRADLRWANLTGANLAGAQLAPAQAYGANLSKADLRNADLSGAELGKADLSKADLRGANLLGTNLIGADLRGADLTATKLHLADLSEADLRRADLRWANLMEARLAGAKLNEAILGLTVFGGTQLNNALGLDTCHHAGPSTIDLRSIGLSRHLPEDFLRGCGLPEEIVQWIPAFLARPISFDSLCIGYAHEDEELARRLHADLQNCGIRNWLAPEDATAGRKLPLPTDTIVRLPDRLLLILSGASLRSRWIVPQIRRTCQREQKDGRPVLFPLRIVPESVLHTSILSDPDDGTDLGAELRRHPIMDFTEWQNPERYPAALRRLVDHLRDSRSSMLDSNFSHDEKFG